MPTILYFLHRFIHAKIHIIPFCIIRIHTIAAIITTTTTIGPVWANEEGAVRGRGSDTRKLPRVWEAILYASRATILEVDGYDDREKTAKGIIITFWNCDNSIDNLLDCFCILRCCV